MKRPMDDCAWVLRYLRVMKELKMELAAVFLMSNICLELG